MAQPAARPATVESPCIGICQLDADSVCMGCGRLMSEIVEWPRADDARRGQIRDRARKRMPATVSAAGEKS